MASKKMDKLKTAGADMDKFFSGQPESPSDSSKKVIRGKDKPEQKKPAEELQKAQEEPKKLRKTDTQKVFSFRAERDIVDSWRVWADAKGMKVDELGEKALAEYIKRHALTEDEQKIYDLKMAQKKKS